MEQNAYKITYTHEIRYWWYTARAKIVSHIFKNYQRKTLKGKNLNILNVGCGTGILSESFSRYGTVFSMDFSSEALRLCALRHLPKIVQADAQKLPYPSSTFDVGLYFDIIEHLSDDKGATFELLRILKEGGLAVITVPAYQFLWSSFDDANWHKRRYTRKKLKNLLDNAGFEILKLSYYNFFLFPFAFLQRIFEKFFRKTRKEYHLPEVGGLTNRLFHWIFATEKHFLKVMRFPWGVSLIAVVRKPSGTNRPIKP